MAIPQISPQDFKGFYKLALNSFREVDLEDYINEFIPFYTKQVIGASAFNRMQFEDFQKWLDLSEGVTFEHPEEGEIVFIGLEKALIGFIYFEFVRDNFTSTVTGKVKGKSELSERATDLEVANLARSRFNKNLEEFNKGLECLLETYDVLESLITASYELPDSEYLIVVSAPKYLNTGQLVHTRHEDFTVSEVITFNIDVGATGSDFTGQTASWDFSEVVQASEDNGDGTYQLIVASTEGLVEGDTVNVNGTDFEAFEVIPNACISIDAGATGSDFTGQTASWSFDSEVTVSFDLNTNQYILAVQDNRYVADAAIVRIDGVNYTISNVASMFILENTETGLSYSGEALSWSPFSAVNFQEIELAGI